MGIGPIDTEEGSSMYEYKVVTQKDRVFGGKFNPELVQSGLNAVAAEGWRVL